MSAHKIAIPTHGTGGLDGQRSAHFGRADSFTIVEVSDGRILGDQVLINPPHEHGGCGRIVSLLAQAGVDTAIVVGMGGGPQAAMRSHNITPLFDDQSSTPRAAVEAFLGGQRVEFGGNHACKGH